MKRRILRIVLLSVLLGAFLQVAASFAGVGLFYHFFYARYDTYCPTDLKVSDLKAPHADISFESDGDTLHGLIIGDGQKGVIVVVHGLNSGMDAHFAAADYFAANGYTVLAFDGRGTRTSEGSSRDSVSTMRDDLNAALDWLASSEYSYLPVYLYGHSSGGYAAATTADRAVATVAIGAFDAPVDLMCETADRYAGFLSKLEKPFLLIWNRIEAGADANERAVDVLNRSQAKILIVTGDSDNVIPPSCTLSAQQNDLVDPNAVFVSYPGGHSDLWLSEEALSYREKIAAHPDAADRLLYNAVDTGFLDAVLAFYEAA